MSADSGSVVAIFIAARSAEPMVSVPSAQVVAGRGIVGDRKFRDPGHPKKDTPEREITLIESEAIEAVNRDYPLRLEPIETRRNLLTRGVALNHLVGRQFMVGSVRMRGLMLCEPCRHVESLTRPGVMRALIHRGGLRAQILDDGVISVGDSIRSVD
ncbi:MOSC domain-containing protein [Fontivita pretiosa]|uniref:MOSC domain-containing protein n=1 Tax=Fontivita pretiosa TaxID=2989684 RepID=UPI003D17F981